MNLKNIIKNASWLSLGQAFEYLSYFIAGILTIRYFGPAEYGYYSYSLAFSYLFLSFYILGADWVLVRELVGGRFNRDALLGTVFYLKLCLGSLATLCAIILIGFVRPNEPWVSTYVALFSLSMNFICFNVISLDYDSRIQAKYAVFVKITVSLIRILLRIILFWTKAPLIYFVYCIPIESAISAFGLMMMHRFSGFDIRKWYFDKQVARKFIQWCWPIFLASIFTCFYRQMDRVLLGHFVEASSLGKYGVVIRICEIVSCIPIVISQSTLASMVSAQQESQEKLERFTQNILNVMTFIYLCVAIMICLFSPKLVLFCFGQSYQESTLYLSIYIWFIFDVFYSLIRTAYLHARGAYKTFVWMSLYSAIVIVSLEVFFISNFGVRGALLAVGLGSVFNIFIINHFFSELRVLNGMILNSWTLIRTLPMLKKHWIATFR